MRSLIIALALAAGLAVPAAAPAQTTPTVQTDFTAADFKARRAALIAQLPKDSVVVVRGMPDAGDISRFRQSADFYYLTGVETPGATLVIGTTSGRATLYLPPRDDREESGGRVLSAEDIDLAKAVSGVDDVAPAAMLGRDLGFAQLRRAKAVYTPFAIAETISRDTLLYERSERAADGWDRADDREGHFRALLAERYPQMEVRDLSPILDEMRLIKDAKEIALIRTATRLAGMGIVEAMRSTAPGVGENELHALARYIFILNGAQGEAYPAIIGGGSNAYFGHYWRRRDALKAGDVLLMDYAPDYRNYASDVARMWPVNGRYTPLQRQVADFILAYRDALIRPIRPGVTSDQVLDAAAKEMRGWLDAHPFADRDYAAAAEDSLKFRGHFQHSVGLTVHDVGRLRGVPLRPGMIFTIDPMMWVHGQRLYFRIEDMVLVTANGHDNMSAWVPSRPTEIEATIAQPGLLQAPDAARFKLPAR